MNMLIRNLARSSRAGLRNTLCCAVLSMATQASLAAKDTPLGIELVPANFPNSSVDDVTRALAITAIVGSHASKIWNWGDVGSLVKLDTLTVLMKQQGLKTMLQMGTHFLGNPSPPTGFVPSFADPATQARFLRDVGVLAASKPDYLVLTTEANLMHRFNNPEFEIYRSLYAQAYALVKTLSPQTQVGVSYLYSLWFANYHIDKIDVPALLKPADFIAFTTYPEWLVREGHFATIADIPPDWYGASRKAYPNERLIFSEVGWASKVRGTPEIQVEYLSNLPRLMSTTHPELLTWSLLHDVEFYTRSLLDAQSTAFLISIGVDIDALFGHFNGMGLLDGFGTPKPGLYTAAQLVFPKP